MRYARCPLHISFKLVETSISTILWFQNVFIAPYLIALQSCWARVHTNDRHMWIYNRKNVRFDHLISKLKIIVKLKFDELWLPFQLTHHNNNSSGYRFMYCAIKSILLIRLCDAFKIKPGRLPKMAKNITTVESKLIKWKRRNRCGGVRTSADSLTLARHKSTHNQFLSIVRLIYGIYVHLLSHSPLPISADCLLDLSNYVTTKRSQFVCLCMNWHRVDGMAEVIWSWHNKMLAQKGMNMPIVWVN